MNDVLYHEYTQAQAARKYGVVRSTIGKWIKRAPNDHRLFIETRSSAPKRSGQALSNAVVDRIIQLRLEHNRCAPIIHAQLKNEGIVVSLSSVERTLRRQGLTRKGKRRASFYKTALKRPLADAPGALVEVDTVHISRPDNSRYYIFTVLDVYSRMAYAYYSPRLTQGGSITAIQQAQERFGFTFKMIQTDNGPEFKDYVTQKLGDLNIKMRHSRVRKPNDNAHLERFNRTLQEECFTISRPNEDTIQKQINEYLEYYNTVRLHFGINCLTPRQFVSKLLT
ncbi:MAG: DDE-type integrase/transposase/recombinase [bacterium]|nr:DDE-type integrase/transposase/recombinase [bacterium]